MDRERGNDFRTRQIRQPAPNLVVKGGKMKQRKKDRIKYDINVFHGLIFC